jgi:spore maturation protein CgeB
MSKTILSFGSNVSGSTSRHRSSAMERLGYQVVTLDVDYIFSQQYKAVSWLNYRTGYILIQESLVNYLTNYFSSHQICPRCIWINDGALFGPKVVRWLQSRFGCPLVLYCNDDPTGPRDWLRYISLRRSFPLFDICICRRDVNILEWQALGAKRVLRVWMSFDELEHVVHHAQSSSSEFSVGFIGTNIPGERRDLFLLDLIMRGVPLKIFGSAWSRSPHWHLLKPYCISNGLIGPSYAQTLSKTSLSLGLLSSLNRDLHTRRSVEIPSAGSVFLAERTSEHKLLFEENVEALFWDTALDCSMLVDKMRSDQGALARICASGQQRVFEVGVGNEDMLRHVFALI